MLNGRLASARTAAAALAIITGSLTAIPSQAQAQAPRGLNAPVQTAPARSSMVDAAATLIEHARSLATEGRFDEARAEYERAAEMQRAEGVLPTDALWQVAAIYNSQERYHRAADVLRQLASEAEASGDLVVQARALLEATILYQQAGRTDAMMHGARRLRQLRASPYLPQELRDAIDSRVTFS